MQVTINSTHDPILDELVETNARVWLKRIAIGLVVLLVLIGIGYGIKKVMSGGAPQKKASDYH